MRSFVVLPVFALALACSPGAPKPAEPVADLLIREVSVLDFSDGTHQPRDLLVANGMILEVADGGTVAVERATQVVEGKGLFAMPGLIDVHAHIGDGGLSDPSEQDREALGQFLRYGVTTIFVPGGGGGNDDQLLSYKERCSSAELTCPDIFGSGALITAPGSHPIGTIWGLPADVDPAVVYDRGAIAVAPQDDIEALVDRKVAMQVDAIKIVIEDGIGPVYPMPRLSKAKVEQLVDAFHQRGLRVFAHISMASHVEDGVAGGIDGIMHSPEEPLAQETLVAMAQRGVFYVATLSLLDGMLDRSHGIVGADHEPYALAGSSQRALDSLRNYRFSPFSPDEATELEVVLSDNLRRAAAAGVPLALGTDVNNPSVFPGYSAHEELFLMVESGLTTREVLAAATGGGASFLGLQDRLGRIAPGYQADLLLLTGNPLDDILNTRSLFAVFSNGRSVEKVVSTAVTVR